MVSYWVVAVLATLDRREASSAYRNELLKRTADYLQDSSFERYVSYYSEDGRKLEELAIRVAQVDRLALPTRRAWLRRSWILRRYSYEKRSRRSIRLRVEVHRRRSHESPATRPGRRGVVARLSAGPSLRALPRIVASATTLRAVELVRAMVEHGWRGEPSTFVDAQLDAADVAALLALLTCWHAHAACRGDGPAAWFPTPSERTKVDAARVVCATCPVRADCDAAAIATGAVGVWAGRPRPSAATAPPPDAGRLLPGRR